MTAPRARPPAFWVRVRDAVLPADEAPRLARELDELYGQRVERDGEAAARRWYRRQVVAFAAAAVARVLRAPFVGAGDALRDVRIAVRSLARAPVVSSVALVTLAVGIGASALVFSLVDGVLLRPLPYPEPDRLVGVWDYTTRGELDVLRTASGALEDARGYLDLDLGVNLERDGGAERLATSFVEPGLFDMLGARPLVGRLFGPEESGPGHTGVALLGEGLWRSRFGADPGIVGRTIQLDGRAHEVVGVLPAAWTFPRLEDQLWLPLEWDPTRPGPFWGTGGIQVVGRLATGVTPSAAQRELRGLSPMLAERNPLWSPPPEYRATASVRPLREALTGDAEGTLLLLSTAVLVMLLAVCGNVAGLLMTRALERQPLVALRSALGAGRARLARASLLEGALLGAAGAGAGGVLAQAALSALEPTLLAQIPRASEIDIDGRVLAAAALLGVLSGLVANTVPTLRALRGDPGTVLREGGRGGGMGRRRALMSRLLVAGQIAAAVVLVASTGLLVRSLAEVGDIDPGLRTDGILTAEVTFPATPDDDAGSGEYAEILARVRALPGVQAVAMAGTIPFGRRNEAYATFVDEAGMDPNALPMIDVDRVSPGYFATLGIPVLEGRGFDGRDRAGAPLVALVDELLAREYWPGRSPVGGRVRFPWAGAPWIDVVGVVGSVADDRLGTGRKPRWYIPLAQHVTAEVALVVATDGSPATLTPSVRAAVAEVDPGLPLSRATPYEALLGDSEARTRLTARLLAAFALTALLLGCLGVYGVAAQAVRERTREIGVRMALGAGAGSIVSAVLREGLLLTVPGVLVGLAGAAAATRLLEGMLVGVRALDPTVFLGVPLLLALAAVLALWLPARRATRIDPVQVLRRG